MKKIILSFFLFPILFFSYLHADSSYSEEQVELILPADEQELWVKERVFVDDANSIAELWVYQPSTETSGKVLFINSQKHYEGWEEEFDEIINMSNDELKQIVKEQTASFLPDILEYIGIREEIEEMDNEEITVTLLSRTDSEIVAMGQYKQGFILFRWVFTPRTTHTLIFSSWGEEGDQGKWIDILQQAQIR